MNPRGNGSLSEEEYREIMEEQEREREARQTASQMANQAAMQGGRDERGNEPGYWDVIGNPDIGREIDDQHLEDFMATEFSNKFAIGNIKYSDWESMQWQIENEFWTARNEFQSPDSTLEDDDMRIMHGETKPKMTDEMARRLRSAGQVKKAQTSLMVGAEGLRRGTEIHAVAKSETQNEPGEDKDGGFLSKLAR